MSKNFNQTINLNNICLNELDYIQAIVPKLDGYYRVMMNIPKINSPQKKKPIFGIFLVINLQIL